MKILNDVHKANDSHKPLHNCCSAAAIQVRPEQSSKIMPGITKHINKIWGEIGVTAFLRKKKLTITMIMDSTRVNNW